MNSILEISDKSTSISIQKPAPELTIVVPTYNEHDNVYPLVNKLKHVLKNYAWEVIFVDDNSPDGTSDVVRKIGMQDCRIRCIRRINRRGLSGAFLEGALASQASYVAVIDGDLQHDERILPKMLESIRNRNIDIAVATRYDTGNSSGGFSASREQISKWSTKFAKRFLGVSLSDPMSGFFMIRRSLVEELAPTLKTQGFKILLDIVTTSNKNLKIVEIPFTFRNREYGKSKLDTRVAFDFISLVISKLTGNLISARFLLFCLVGLTGLGLNMLLLDAALKKNIQFNAAQIISAITVIAYNFTANNILTYGDKRLTGKRFFRGIIRFEIICSISLIANVGVAQWIYAKDSSWWLAGLCGAAMGAIWNYIISATLIWNQR